MVKQIIKENPMKAPLIAVATVALLAGCAHQQQCVQPDPVEPAHNKCWEKGVDCGTGIKAFKGTEAAAPAKASGVKSSAKVAKAAEKAEAKPVAKKAKAAKKEEAKK